MSLDVSQLLAFAGKNNASDLHLSAGVPPMIRVDGDMRRINMPALDHKEVHGMVYDIMNDKQRKDFEEFSGDRLFLRDSRTGALPRQRIQPEPRRRRGVPNHSVRHRHAGRPRRAARSSGTSRMQPRGIVLVTGPTGSGKSTTLAGMIELRQRQPARTTSSPSRIRSSSCTNPRSA